MKTCNCGPSVGRLPMAMLLLGMALLLAACGSSSTTTAVEPDGTDSSGPMIELGDWNMLTAGSLDIGDGNDVLRAHYDAMGEGHVTAMTPVQPAGTGTATWDGMWSGRIELNPDPLARAGLEAFGVNPDGLEQLGGGAQMVAYLEEGNVMAQLTYRDIGVEGLDLSEISFDRVPVTNGLFEPRMTYNNSFDAETANPFDPTAPTTITHATITGDFNGEGAFGGTDAVGVVGYLGGGMYIEYGRGPTSLGTLKSVFYGTRNGN